MILTPPSHLCEFSIKRTLKLFELWREFAVNISNFSIEAQTEDEVDIIFKF